MQILIFERQNKGALYCSFGENNVDLGERFQIKPDSQKPASMHLSPSPGSEDPSLPTRGARGPQHARADAPQRRWGTSLCTPENPAGTDNKRVNFVARHRGNQDSPTRQRLMKSKDSEY